MEETFEIGVFFKGLAIRDSQKNRYPCRLLR